MNTPTHCLINWTLASKVRRWLGIERLPKSAVLLGSIAPDIPLYLLSAVGFFWFGYVRGWEIGEVGRHLYGNLFYNDRVWISLHNTLHSPLVLVAAIAVLLGRMGWDRFRQSWTAWFFASCLFHTIVDIPVHHDDGPLVFWPLNWSYRYASPLSYWDTDHYGAQMMWLEAILVLLLTLRLGWLSLRKIKRSSGDPG